MPSCNERRRSQETISGLSNCEDNDDQHAGWNGAPVFHGQGCCPSCGGFDGHSLARRQWHQRSIRGNKNESSECHYGIAVFPQRARGRIGASQLGHSETQGILIPARVPDPKQAKRGSPWPSASRPNASRNRTREWSEGATADKFEPRGGPPFPGPACGRCAPSPCEARHREDSIEPLRAFPS